MASIEAPRAAIDASRHFYVAIAGFIFVFTLVAFARTYWAPMAAGSLDMHAAFHAHAALFFAWTFYFLIQTMLVAQGRTLLHREFGMLGVALAGAMVFSGVLVVIVNLSLLMGTPRERIVLGTAILALSAMVLFASFMTAAVANIRQPEWHKRLMVLATFSLLQAVVARYVLLIPDLAQPHRALISAAIVDLLLMGVILADARIKGRIHPAYLVGSALLLFVQVARSPLTHTPLWHDACAWLASLAGAA